MRRLPDINLEPYRGVDMPTSPVNLPAAPQMQWMPPPQWVPMEEGQQGQQAGALGAGLLTTLMRRRQAGTPTPEGAD